MLDAQRRSRGSRREKFKKSTRRCADFFRSRMPKSVVSAASLKN
jgi:hypothetical protein